MRGQDEAAREERDEEEIEKLGTRSLVIVTRVCKLH